MAEISESREMILTTVEGLIENAGRGVVETDDRGHLFLLPHLTDTNKHAVVVPLMEGDDPIVRADAGMTRRITAYRKPGGAVQRVMIHEESTGVAEQWAMDHAPLIGLTDSNGGGGALTRPLSWIYAKTIILNRPPEYPGMLYERIVAKDEPVQDSGREFVRVWASDREITEPEEVALAGLMEFYNGMKVVLADSLLPHRSDSSSSVMAARRLPGRFDEGAL